MSLKRAETLGATCVALACAMLLTAWAQTDPSSPRAWNENFDFQLEIDGKLDTSARLFGTLGRASMLVASDQLKQPLVIEVGERKILRVDAAAMAAEDNRTQVLLADDRIGGPALPFTLDGDSVIFFSEGRKLKVSRKPPLLGTLTLDELLAKLPIYRSRVEEYAPAEQDTIYLKSYKHDVRVEVYFGSWCPACKQTVPGFIKSLNVAANPKLQASFIGLPVPPFTAYAPAKAKDIKSVPTFIVYVGDKEIGRINHFEEDSSVERELVKILFAYQQDHG